MDDIFLTYVAQPSCYIKRTKAVVYKICFEPDGGHTELTLMKTDTRVEK